MRKIFQSLIALSSDCALLTVICPEKNSFADRENNFQFFKRENEIIMVQVHNPLYSLHIHDSRSILDRGVNIPEAKYHGRIMGTNPCL